MGLFWDKLKGLFKKPEQLPPSSPEIAAGLAQYERNERADHPDKMDAVRYAVDAANWHYEVDGSDQEQWEKQIKPPIRSNRQLHYRKAKSQQRNWNKWKKRLRR